MRLSVVALILAGAGFLVFGIAMAVAPQAVMASIGWHIPDGVPTTEVRAFYGGLELALGGLLLFAAAQPAQRRAGLVLGAVSYGTVALTRAFGLLIDDTGGSFLLGALATEITLALLCAYAWTKS